MGLQSSASGDAILLTEAEAAQRLRLSARTLRNARNDGLLRYVLIGRSVRYTIEDLESYIDLFRQVTAPCPKPAPASPSKRTRRGQQSAVIVPFHQRKAKAARGERL